MASGKDGSRTGMGVEWSRIPITLGCPSGALRTQAGLPAGQMGLGRETSLLSSKMPGVSPAEPRARFFNTFKNYQSQMCINKETVTAASCTTRGLATSGGRRTIVWVVVCRMQFVVACSSPAAARAVRVLRTFSGRIHSIAAAAGGVGLARTAVALPAVLLVLRDVVELVKVHLFILSASRRRRTRQGTTFNPFLGKNLVVSRASEASRLYLPP